MKEIKNEANVAWVQSSSNGQMFGAAATFDVSIKMSAESPGPVHGGLSGVVIDNKI